MIYLVKRVNRLKYRWSDKHKEYMRRTADSAINIAEGSIRSGKTTDNIFCFAYALKKSEDKLHLATASTQATAKLIIGDCDGYGLEHIFRGQCRWGKYKGNECLRIKGIDTGYKEKIVLFCGGAKADSYKRFRGMSIGLWIATEINLHHENTIREAMRRQINADIKRLFWDLNPESPTDPIYTEFIDKWQESADKGILQGGYNYQSFNIFDNINLSKKNLDEELSKYTVGDVFYRRDILGERCAAQGLIYPMFANEPQKYIVSSPPSVSYAAIGVDFGGNRSAHSFTCTGFTDNMRGIIVLDEFYLKKDIPPSELEREFTGFVKRNKEKYKIYEAFCDSAETTLIRGLRNAAVSERLGIDVREALKAPVNNRIRFFSMSMSFGHFKIMEHCTNTIKAICTAVWDEKKKDDVRLDDGSTNIDSLDSMEYSVEKNMRYIMDLWRVGKG